MRRAEQRKTDLTDEALTALVLRTYGPTTSLADLHPDVRELFHAAMDLNAAVAAGDGAWMAGAIGGVCALITRYAGEDDLPTADTTATMSPPTDTGHGDAITIEATSDVVGTPGST